MAAPTARIDKGTFTRSNGVNEANIHIESIDFAPTRTETFYQDIATGADVIGHYDNPSATWSFSGMVTTVAGFATQHPGTAVTTLANFSAEVAGCDPAEGIMIFKDPTHKWSPGKPRELSWAVLWKPLME
jgi:hypothetical protein